jgi:SAM-dependent methyltransferase
MQGNGLDRYREGYDKAAKYYNLFAKNDDIPFYLSYAAKMGSPVLELAAGTGRVSIELATAGFDVVALEKSRAMLDEFRNRLSSLDQSIAGRIALVEGDMRSFELQERFPLIIIPTSFGHALTTDEQISLLNCVRRHLTNDGLFILDIFPGGLQPDRASFEEPWVPLGDGTEVSRSGILKTNPVSQILELDLTFTVRDISTGETLEKIDLLSGAAMVYNREADLLLRLTGLRLENEFGDYKWAPYTSGSAKRIMLLKRQ